MFYRDAHGALVVFDLTDEHSFEATKQWATELRQNRGPSCPIVVVGNKVDLRDQRSSKIGAAKTWADSHSYDYFETSAKTGSNVEQAFLGLLKKMATIKQPVVEPGQTRRRTPRVRFEETEPPPDESCC
jgi:GTPase SAR1 family protein